MSAAVVSPVILQLLGKWTDGEIIFELPQRPDLFKRRTAAFPPTITLNQFSVCSDGEHDHHFLTANSAIFPGAENSAEPLEGPPEPENLNWQPYLRQDHILNWNLEEELVPLVDDDDDDAGRYRHRRQARTTWEEKRMAELQEIAANLEPEQSFVRAYMRDKSKVVSVENVYSQFSLTLVSGLSTRQFPALSDHFQHIWDKANSWSIAARPVAKPDREPFMVVIVVPPFCTLRFNDVSVLQALGFDSVNQEEEDEQTVLIKEHAASQCNYCFENRTEARRMFVAKRAITNMKLSGLRALAKSVWREIPAARRKHIPEIENETTEVATTFKMHFEWTGVPEDKKIKPIFYKLPEDAEQLLTLGTTAEKLEFFKFYLSSCCCWCATTTVLPGVNS